VVEKKEGGKRKGKEKEKGGKVKEAPPKCWASGTGPLVLHPNNSRRELSSIWTSVELALGIWVDF